MSVDGKRVRKSTGLKDTKENRKKVLKDLPKLEREIKSDGLESIETSKSVAYYIGVFINNLQGKPNTIRKYSGFCKDLKNKFGAKKIDEVKVSEVRSWIANELKTKSVKTIKNKLIVYRGVFKEAFYDEAIIKNPFDYVQLPKAEKPDIEPFSKEEVELLLTCESKKTRDIIAVLFYTGMRVGELLALRWDDIDWNSNQIYIQRTMGEKGVQPTKTYTNRYVPIFDPLVPHLKSLFADSGLKNEFVLLTKDKLPYTDTSSINTYFWKPLLRSLGLRHRRLYNLRHTFAIHMLDSGKFKASLISKWLGHNTTQMLFTTYARFIKSENEHIDNSFNLLNCEQKTPQFTPQSFGTLDKAYG